MSAPVGSCRTCGGVLPPARTSGRPRQYCSSTCRSAGRRARAREAALRLQDGGPCTAELAGRRCPRPAEHTLIVSGTPFRFCSACHSVTAQYLMDQQVPASELVTTPRPVSTEPPRPRPEPPARSGAGPSRPSRVLLIEDDDAVREALRISLKRQGYEVLAEGTGRAGLRSAYLQSPDLVLLDVMLPDLDGFEVLRRLRAVSDVPVIHLTARSDPVDVVVGLENGADDYIVKPCHGREIGARIRRVLYRYRATERRQGDVFDDGLLRLDSPRLQAWTAGSPLALSGSEFRVLDRLVRHAGTVQRFATLLEAGWGTADPGARDRVKFAVSRLRGKLDATPVGGDSLVSVRGTGYLYRSPALPAPPAAGPASAPAGYGHARTVQGATRKPDRGPAGTDAPG
ncbi:response regulator transcription factor [Streptomyces sp. NPDC127068]|uniref:response regulator transcription factor n=1 Tax=Streptomyces sp. NPDC127068 TaxID=3347127 RepID=UPI00365D06B5